MGLNTSTVAPPCNEDEPIDKEVDEGPTHNPEPKDVKSMSFCTLGSG